jgi:hypothetical protein
VTGKSLTVQAGLWMLPLVALAGLQWRDHLIWAGFEAVYFVAVWLYIGGLSRADRGLPAGGYSLLLGLRVAAWLFLLVQVWRVARSRGPSDPPALVDAEPEGEVVAGQEGAGVAEEEGDGDPLAGPMAGAPDRVLVHLG